MDSNIGYLRELRLESQITMYIVGSYIRDFFLGKKAHTIDVYVESNAEKMAMEYAAKIGGRAIKYQSWKNLWRILDSKNQLVGNFHDMKGENLETSLKNRDFTINSLAIEVFNVDLMNKITIIDYFGGLDDLEDKKIRTVSKETFDHNPLRLLKAIRYMAELEFDLEENTHKLIKEKKELLKNVENEKYTYEIFKILASEYSNEYIEFMEKEFDMFQIVFPEIIPMKCTGKCKYHTVDVFTHSVQTLKKLEFISRSDGFFEPHIRKTYEKHSKELMSHGRNRLQIIKLASLFHDVGKPESEEIDKEGRTRFGGHEITGGRIIESISKRLNLADAESNLMKKIVEKHMIPLDIYTHNDVSGKALYERFKTTGDATLDVFLIALADITATRELLNPKEELHKFKVFIEYLVDNYLTRYLEVQNISDIVNGRDLIEKLKIDSGSHIGELIEEIRKAIYYGIIGRDEFEVIEYAKQIVSEIK